MKQKTRGDNVQFRPKIAESTRLRNFISRRFGDPSKVSMTDLLRAWLRLPSEIKMTDAERAYLSGESAQIPEIITPESISVLVKRVNSCLKHS